MFKPMSIPQPQPIQLRYWPQNPTTYNGGLNLVDREWKIPDNQSSKILNMWWKEGELSKRLGQEIINYVEANPAISVYGKLYGDKIIAHIGDKIIAISKE